ncbi:MAG: TrkH family potassium uptake protein, partial [Clostridiales bacterium]|nr:TrkH family potassium uptake protein [Clostridiales bacterium]
VITGEIPNFVNALFETVSGFTTTGASILDDVEGLSHTALFWRSFTHWLGGMGVLVFLLAVIPMSGGSNINLMRAESPGPSVGKLVPKIGATARILYKIYLAMTVIEVILLLIGGMSLFDSLCLSFGTAGTGGFGVKADSFASYSAYVQWIAAIFMFLFGVNFNAYYFLLLRQFKRAFTLEEVKGYAAMIAMAVAVVFISIADKYESAFQALTHAFFQVSSLTSSTGFASDDFDLWPSVAKYVLLIMMFVGACAGSTGGGVKVSRIIVLMKTIRKELSSYIHPKIVRKVNMDGKPVEHDVIRAINVYLITFFSILMISIFILSFEDHDLETTFTAVLACLNNIGPGLSKVGPTCNYGFLNPLSKFVLMFDMLAGRLELFPMLILFHPSLYKGALSHRKDR